MLQRSLPQFNHYHKLFYLKKKQHFLYFFIIIHIHIPTFAYTTSVEWEPYLRDSIFNTYNASKFASLLHIHKYIKPNKACHLGSATLCLYEEDLH